MKYYAIDELGKFDLDMNTYCITRGNPKGTAGLCEPLEFGGSIDDIYPEDPFDG